MATYSWIEGKWIDKETGEPLQSKRTDHNWWEYGAPSVIREIEPYSSPITNKPIETRKERREEMKKHNCVEYDPPKTEVFELSRERNAKRKRDKKQ